MPKTFISWNVNGMRSVLKKGFLEFVDKYKPDVLCLQETKANQSQVEIELPEYSEYWNSAERKGYAGTAMFSREEPVEVWYGFRNSNTTLADDYGDAETEGRVITADFGDYYLVNVYTPNSKPELERLSFRENHWDPAFLNYVQELEQTKPVIFCGDLNVAHQEIDLARPKQNRRSAGFTDEERQGFDNIVEAGFLDTFRMFHQEGGNYTYWSYLGNARSRNVGWRIDYFCASPQLRDKLQDAFILDQVYGSDHCPVGVEIAL